MWWQSLTQFEQALFVVSMGSLVVLIIEGIIRVFKVYKIDKLNAERDNVEKYDRIANDDSDVEERIPKFFSLVSVNLFLFVLGVTRVVFKVFLSGFWLLALNYFVSSLVFVLYSFIKRKEW